MAQGIIIIVSICVDLRAADDDALMEFMPQLADMVRKPNELVYIHCWGGHGRTGIVIALLLVILYELDGEEALRLTELYHSKRTQIRGQHSPQTRVQIEQVKRLAKKLMSF